MTPIRRPRGKSFADLFPEKTQQWHPELNGDLTPDLVSRGSTVKAWWTCPEGHPPFEQQVRLRAMGRSCPACAPAKRSKAVDIFDEQGELKPPFPVTGPHRGLRSLAVLHPALAAEWSPRDNGVSAEDILPESDFQAVWNCPGGHTYTAGVNRRVAGDGCTECPAEALAA